MSLVPSPYTVYKTASASSYYFSGVQAYVYVNYVQCISATQVTISTYYNRGTSGSINNFYSIASGTFYGGGVGIGSYAGSAANNTIATTVTYFPQITGTITTYVSGNDNYAGGVFLQAEAGISLSVNFITPTQPFTLVTTSGYYIVRLPAASTCIGQLFFVKNDQSSGYVAVSTISTSEVIDGLTMNQLKLARGACVCVSAISSTQWSILTYWSGTDGPIVQQSSYPTTTQITSPIVTVDIGSVDRWLGLPDPATWGKGNFLIINAYQTSTAAPTYSCYVPVAPYSETTGSLVRNELRGGANEAGPTPNCYVLKPAADLLTRYDHNASLILISDGTLWNNVGFFNGAGCYFDRWINGVPANGATTSGIVTHGAGGWSTTHSSTLADNSGRLYFSKMNGTTSQQYGTIIGNQGNAIIRGVIGMVYTPSPNTVTGSISGTTLTITSTSLPILPIGTYVTGNGVADGTYIQSQETSIFSANYLKVCTVNISQTVSSTQLTFNYGWGRVYKNNPEAVNYSGFALCQVNISNTTVHFPIAMYPSFY